LANLRETRTLLPCQVPVSADFTCAGGRCAVTGGGEGGPIPSAYVGQGAVTSAIVEVGSLWSGYGWRVSRPVEI